MIIIEKILFLKRISIFQSLSSQELRVISEVTAEEEFAAGEVLFAQGQQGDCMYFVVDGRINIYSGTPPTIKVLAVFQAGDFFGEMGLYDDKPRAASAMALDASRLLVLRKADFCELISDYPEVALGIMKELNQRIRETNMKLTSFEGHYIDKSSRMYARDYFVDCMSAQFLKAKQTGAGVAFFTLKASALEIPEPSTAASPPPTKDQVLAELGRVLNMHQRPHDFSARLSEKKLVVMLTEANKDGAAAFQRRVQSDIDKLAAHFLEIHGVKMEIVSAIHAFPHDAAERDGMLKILEAC
jgi:CRP-like cAMP-binding protein